MTQHNIKEIKNIITVKLHESNCRMMKLGEKS